MTKRIAGDGREISDTTIVIELSGPDCPLLTLIDLPGFVRNVVAGAQSKDTIDRIKSLSDKYMKQPNRSSC